MVEQDPAAVAIRGEWWRHNLAGADPWQRPWPPATNRWQRGDVVGALYLADSPETAWAEWYRYLAERAIPPTEAMPRDLWCWRVDLARVADLRSADALRSQLLVPARPDSAQWPAFQRAGEALHHAGWPAVVAPSAARPSGLLLCIVRTSDRLVGLEPAPPPRRYAEPPAPPRGMTT